MTEEGMWGRKFNCYSKEDDLDEEKER